MATQDPLAGYTPDWRRRYGQQQPPLPIGGEPARTADDPLAGYTPDWRERRTPGGERTTLLGRALGAVRDFIRPPELEEAERAREPFDVRAVQRQLADQGRRRVTPGMVGAGPGVRVTPIEEIRPEDRSLVEDVAAGVEAGRRASIRGVGTTLATLGAEGVGRELQRIGEPVENLRPRVTGNRWLDFLAETAFDVGAGAASTIPSLIGGAVGTAVGGPVGGLAGAAAPAGVQTFGGLKEELEAEGVDPRTATGAAAVVAPLAAALEAIVPARVGGRLIRAGAEQVAGGLARQAARGFVHEGLTEAATEAAQTALERGAVAATTPREFLSQETLGDILRGARAGFLTGGLLGAGSSAVAGIGPDMAANAYTAELDRLTAKYGENLEGITDREAARLERLARRAARAEDLGDDVLEPIARPRRPAQPVEVSSAEPAPAAEEAAPAPAEVSVAPGVRQDVQEDDESSAPAEPEPVAAPPEQARPREAGDVGLFPVAEIRADPQRFQYKADVDPESGAGSELKGVRRFDHNLAGVIQVWRDPEDGQVYVINGHHRLDLAKRLGEEEMLVRFIDARDAAEARMIGAMTNIAEGRGTAIDAAKIFREARMTPEDLERRGISLRGAVARDGLALANLPQVLFDDVVARRLSIPRAAIIGGSGLSEEQQLALAKLLEQKERGGRRLTNEEAAELVRFVRGAGETQVETVDLFGPQVLQQNLALEKAELSAYVKKQLAQDRRLFGFVGRSQRAQRIQGSGAGRINVDRAQEIAEQAAQAEEIYNRLSTMSGPVSDALNAAARRLAAGEDATQVKKDLYDQVREAVGVEIRNMRGARAPIGVAALAYDPYQVSLFGEPVGRPEPVQGELLPAGPGLDSPRLSEAEQGARQIVSLLEGKVRRGAASKAEIERYEAARKLLARAEKMSREEVASEARRAGVRAPEDPGTGELFGEAIGTDPGRLRIGERRTRALVPSGAEEPTAVDTRGAPLKVPASRIEGNYLNDLGTYTDRLFRETSLDEVESFIPGSNALRDLTADALFLANTPNLARGQGDNRGVLLEFDAAGLQGQVNTRKPAWEFAWGQGEAEFIARFNDQPAYQNALRSITIRPDAQGQKALLIRLQRHVLPRLEREGWQKTTLPDGSVRYTRPETVQSAAGGRPRIGERVREPVATYGRDVTQTEEFRRWFGNSKVVDEQGRPLVVYHGTKGDFDAFLPEYLGTATGARSAREGFFFADNPLVAAAYSETMPRPDDVRRVREIEARKDEIRRRRNEIFDQMDRLAGTAPEGQEPTGWSALVAELDALAEEERTLDREYLELRSATRPMSPEARRRPGANVMPVYLSIQNPLVIDMAGREYDGAAVLEAVQSAKEGGHDGLLVRNAYDAPVMYGGDAYLSNIWVAFRPEQIKSATGNRGTFDPNNPSIIHERRNRRGMEQQLELTFGSVDAAKDVIRDLAREAGPLLRVSIPGVPMTAERIEAVKRGREAAFAWVPATGHVLQTRDGRLDHESLFRLLRSYRHPAAEYWHILVLVPSGDGQLEVAHHRMSSAGALDASFVFAGDIVEAAAIARRRGGQVVFAHNHPSGDPWPSPEDRDVTIHAAKIIGNIGAEFGGHLVINHEEAYLIDANNDTRSIQLLADPGAVDWNLHDRRKRITGPDSVADYLSGFPVDQSRVDVLILNTQHQIVAFEARPIGDLDTLGEWLPALQRDAAASSIVIGTGGQQAYERAIRAVNAISGVGVLDVINAPTRESAVMQGRLEKARLATAPAMVPIFERRAPYGEGAEGDTPAVPGRPGEPPGVRPGRFARRVREGVPGAETEGGRAGEGEGAIDRAAARRGFAPDEIQQLRAAAAYAPIVRIRGDEFGSFAFDPVDIQRARDRAREYLIREVAGTSVVNEATGETIHFNRTGIKKTLSHAANADHVRSLYALPDLMRNARHVTREPNRDPAQAHMVPWVHTYAARLQIGERVVTVKLVVKEARDGRRFYDHELLERIEPGGRVRTSSLDKPEDALSQPPGSTPTVAPAASEIKPGEATGRPRLGERRPRYVQPAPPSEPAEALTPLLPGWAELKAAALAEGQRAPRFRGLASERLPDAGRFERGTAKEAPRPSDILRDIRDGLNIKIGVGRFGSGRYLSRALGIYKVRPRAIRLGSYGDIATLGHELGHDLHRLFFGTVEGRLTDDHFVFQPWADELAAMARGISDESLAEGWAEFWRRYIDNPDVLPERAPKLLAYAEARLEREFPAVKTVLEKARRQWRLYREAGPQARIAAKISTAEKEPHLGIRDHWRRLRTDVIDDFEPIRHVVQQLTGTDRPANLEEDAITLARLARGSTGTAEAFLEYGTLDFRTLRRTGKSLKEVLAPVTEHLDDFRDYIVARRARELHARGIETGIRPEDADAVVQQVEASELGERFRQAFQDLQGYNRALLQYLVDAGVMSSETMTKILETNQNYVPFYRVMDDQPAKGGRFSLGFGHLFSPVKRIQGSGRDIIDPLESLIKNTYTYIHLAARQQVSNALARLAEREGAARYLERIPAPRVPQRFRLREIEQQLEELLGKDVIRELRQQAKRNFEAATEGMDPEEIKAAGLEPSDPGDEILMFFRPGDYFGQPNVISVLQNGQRVWYEVDPELYRALEGLDREAVGALTRLLSIPARTLRAGATLAPEFQLRNPIRDQTMAFIQSEYGFKPGIDLVRGMFSLLKKDEFYWQWKAAGGERAALTSLDRKAMRQNVERLVRQGGVRNVLKNPLDVLRAISAIMEDATRMGEFRRAVAAEGTSKQGLQRAAAAAREISIDFARHGAKTTALRQIAAFWNARLQGYDRLARAIKRNPVGAMARIGAGITLPTVILYAVNRDDPEYWEIPQWERDLFWHVKIRGQWVKIPKPFELGIAFGTIPERILEWVESKDPEGLRHSLGDFLKGEIAATIFPQVTSIQPLIENLTNYSFFLRRPIVPRSMERVEPRYQATEQTSEIAKLLGRWTNTSPLKIDNLLIAWTGGLGRLASQTVDTGVGLLTEPGRTVEEMAAAGPEDVPGVRGVFSRTPGFSSESVERFYRRYAEAMAAEATIQHFEREERWDDLEAFLSDPRNEERLAEADYLRRASDVLAKLRATAEIIRRDPSLSAEEKKRQVEELGREARDYAAAVIERRTPATRNP